MGGSQRAKVASASRRPERVSHQPTSTRRVTLLRPDKARRGSVLSDRVVVESRNREFAFAGRCCRCHRAKPSHGDESLRCASKDRRRTRIAPCWIVHSWCTPRSDIPMSPCPFARTHSPREKRRFLSQVRRFAVVLTSDWVRRRDPRPNLSHFAHNYLVSRTCNVNFLRDPLTFSSCPRERDSRKSAREDFIPYAVKRRKGHAVLSNRNLENGSRNFSSASCSVMTLTDGC